MFHHMFLWVAAHARLTTMLQLKSVRFNVRSVHIFGDRRNGEQLSTTRSLTISEYNKFLVRLHGEYNILV